MNKLSMTIAAAMVFGAALESSAENQVYTYLDDEGVSVYSSLRRVSPNGIWAAGGDETDETGSIIVNTTDPTVLHHTPDGLITDIDDNGMAVGAYYDAQGYAKYKRAAIYRDNEWIQLPLPEEILGQSYAAAISADSKTIVGHGMCANSAPDEPGKYFPMVWKLDEATGEYELQKLYNNLYLPGTFGFFVLDITPDAKYACGYQCLDMGDIIAALLNLETGEYTIWHKIDYRNFSFEWNGQMLESNGMFVDGVLDGLSDYYQFAGSLIYATDKYIFGRRGVVSNVQPDGSGIISNYATVYDIEAGEFVDGSADYAYSCGVNPDMAFTTNGKIYHNGKAIALSEYLNTDEPIDIVYSIDDAQKVLAGSHIAYTPWGAPYESPVLVLLDESVFSGIADVSVASDIDVNVSGKTVSVTGAQSVEIYDINGRLVANTPVATLSEGVYIILTDGISHKVIIK